MRPEVTFIIPVFNGEEYLGQCLKSVINQSFTATEVICVNDGSADRSGRILDDVKRVDSRVRVIENERNLGAAKSRNRGSGRQQASSSGSSTLMTCYPSGQLKFSMIGLL